MQFGSPQKLRPMAELLLQRRRRSLQLPWSVCAGCAKAHAGARDIASRRCEDCALKWPTFGLPAEGRKRWCGGCARAHAGAQSLHPRRRNDDARKPRCADVAGSAESGARSTSRVAVPPTPLAEQNLAAPDFVEASLVWAKCGRYPWWPAEARCPRARTLPAAARPLIRAFPHRLRRPCLQRQLAAWPAV